MELHLSLATDKDMCPSAVFETFTTSQFWPPPGETTIKNIVFPQVFDKDYIDDQIRKRTVRPFCSDRLDMDHNYVHCNNPNMDEEMEQFFDQFDAEMPYDPNDGVNDQFDPDAFMFTHNDDELAYEDDWMAHDHIL